jgi:hypothetical protein
MTAVVTDPEDVDGSFQPLRDSAVRVEPIGDEAVLIDRFGGVHAVNSTAWLLWECFDGDVTLTALADEIATELAVSRDDVLADSIGIARDLVRLGMVVDARLPVTVPDYDEIAGNGDDGAPDVSDLGEPPFVLAEPPNT